MSSEVEDLFGDGVVVETTSTSAHRSEQGAADQRTSDDEDLFGDRPGTANGTEHSIGDPDDEVESVSEHDAELVTKFTVANYSQPAGNDGELYLAKMPSFLDVTSQPYDADTLLAEIQQTAEASADTDERMTKKRSLVNTVRWKYEGQADGRETRVSNARFVRWSDGTMSLQVGEELFDVPIKNIVKEHSYLTLMHAEEGMLRSMQRFSRSMTFQPFGLSSKSHAELKADIARRAISSKGRTVKLHTEMIDPADFQKQAIKADNEKQKARRRLEGQKARSMNHAGGHRDRTQLTARYLDDSDEELGGGRQRYADENDDGFIEDDEDAEAEDQAGRNRLQALKDAGAATYKEHRSKRPHDNSDEGEEISEDESIVYEDGAREESEEEAVMTPKGDSSPVASEVVPRTKKLKRRIADSEDEDDAED